MTLEEMIRQMNPKIHQRLKTAVELGRWPDGRRLTQEEKEASLQALIVYEGEHLPQEQRVGYIDRGNKQTDCESAAEKSALRPDAENPLKWH